MSCGGGPSAALCQAGRPVAASPLQRKALFRASALSVETSRQLLSSHNPALYTRKAPTAAATATASATTRSIPIRGMAAGAGGAGVGRGGGVVGGIG
ncbi:unnamed protein product, partial [Ectocarpus sp. 8 AP-2014]